MEAGHDRDDRNRTSTPRLDLTPPVPGDVDEWFAVVSDPRLWRHFPSGRPTSRAAVEAALRRIGTEWDAVGLGAWAVRRRASRPLIGYGGCSLRRDAYWNLSYRLAPEAHGHGLATELAVEAVRRANELRPDVPVLALLLEHNRASAAVAQKAGLTLRHRGPDVGNPDPTAVRLIYSDRPVTEAHLDAALHHVG